MKGGGGGGDLSLYSQYGLEYKNTIKYIKKPISYTKQAINSQDI
jgi:hypothetical protein